MTKEKEKIKEILIELIKRQKIGCSNTCQARYGIEGVSVDQAITKLSALSKPEVSEEKIRDIIQLRYFKLMCPDITVGDAETVAGYLAPHIARGDIFETP